MLITINKTITETRQVEVTVPSYWKTTYGMFSFITDDGRVLRVFSSGFICLYKQGDPGYDSAVADAINGKPCEELEFIQAFNSAQSLFQTLASTLV